MTSAALIGVPAGSRARRVPFAHIVWLSSSTGSGLRREVRGRARRPAAGRRQRADEGVADQRAAGEARLLVGRREDLDGAPLASPRCRGSGGDLDDSWTVISDLAQCTAPKPMPSSARVMPRPRNMLFSRTSPTSFGSIGNSMYATIGPDAAEDRRGRRACRPALCRFSRLRVHVGDARTVRREPGVLERVSR